MKKWLNKFIEFDRGAIEKNQYLIYFHSAYNLVLKTRLYNYRNYVILDM